ncbi:MAG: cytochrome P450 [Polyangiales bacterium]
MKLLLNLPRVDLPGPPPALGFRLPNLLRFFRDPVGHLVELHGRYGDVVALTAGDPTWVAVRGADRLRTLLSDAVRFQNLADSPIPVPKGSAPEVLFGQAVTALNGADHKRARRLMMPVFSKGAVASYHDEVVGTIERVLAAWPASGVVDVAAVTLDLALQIALSSLFGVPSGAQAAEIARLSQAFLDGVLSMGVMMFPADLPGTPYRRWIRECQAYEALLRGLVADRRANPQPRRDVLSTLIAARDEDGSQLVETELVAHGAVLLTASHETTANTLAWTLFLLAAHPEVQDAVADSLKGLGAPSVAQLAGLTLLDQVVKESQRLLPASCILFFREATAPFALDGRELPAGTRLLTSPYVAHRDPTLFPEPQRFRPARWDALEPGPYAFMPFGAGPRLCIGAQFATQAVRLALAAILQRYRFDIAPGCRVDRHVRGITLGPKAGIRLTLRPRDAAPGPGAGIAGDIHALVDGLPRA